MLTRPKHSLDRLPTPKASGHDPMRSLTAHLVGKMPGDVGVSARGPVTSFLFLRHGPRDAKLGLTGQHARWRRDIPLLIGAIKTAVSL
jgi:hypothetical protein